MLAHRLTERSEIALERTGEIRRALSGCFSLYVVGHEFRLCLSRVISGFLLVCILLLRKG